MSTIIQVGRWKKIDPEKEMHLGHLHEKDGHRAHDKKCDYCGRWMTYDIKSIHLWGDNVKMGFHDWPEKVHCGSQHCIEYHRRYLKHEDKIKAEAKRVSDLRFLKLTKMGLIS